MDALFKFAKIAVISIFLPSCVNGVGANECRYLFSDEEIVGKFKNAMVRSPDDLEVFNSSNGKFNVRRLNCNYYVTFNLEPMRVDGRALLIFDSAGEMIVANVR